MKKCVWNPNRAAEICAELKKKNPTHKLSKLGEWMNDPNAKPLITYDENDPSVLRAIMK